MRKTYERNEHDEMIRAVMRRGEPVRAADARLGVPVSTAYGWIRAATDAAVKDGAMTAPTAPAPTFVELVPARTPPAAALIVRIGAIEIRESGSQPPGPAIGNERRYRSTQAAARTRRARCGGRRLSESRTDGRGPAADRTARPCHDAGFTLAGGLLLEDRGGHMGHRLRLYIERIVYEGVSRTLGGAFWLRPDPACNAIIEGVIGKALTLYPDVRMHAFTLLR
ncbi:MAG: hypothetical protein R3B06_12565 [Kofleriaceae bacterium]